MNFLSYRISPIFLTIFLSCSGDGRPNFIPQEAKFDKKRNLYVFQKDHLQTSWFADGSLYSKCETNQFGARNGECKFFAKNGILISQGQFKEEQRDGMWIWNFSDGTLYYKQSFSYGKRKEFWIQILEWGNEHGLYERYYKNGDLEEKGFFDSGEKHGSWVKYYINGQKEYNGMFHHGKKIAKWVYYYPDGSVEGEEVYTQKGDLVSRITRFKDGKIRCREISDRKFLECND